VLRVLGQARKNEEFERWSNYVQKRWELEQKAKRLKEAELEQKEQEKQKARSKQDRNVELRHEMFQEMDRKANEYHRRMEASDKQMALNRHKLKLEKLKKDEVQHLKRIN